LPTAFHWQTFSGYLQDNCQISAQRGRDQA
jgi:hypothetical protein